uniref:Uncharacterized protein n=1 Tax=Ananas comosus var. bracteatus TaxID=296719 RepID=A0A6V7P2U4_ANACO|nr:unnamed protein product [Ananas comosus var. bracteatus]
MAGELLALSLSLSNPSPRSLSTAPLMRLRAAITFVVLLLLARLLGAAASPPRPTRLGRSTAEPSPPTTGGAPPWEGRAPRGRPRRRRRGGGRTLPRRGEPRVQRHRRRRLHAREPHQRRRRRRRPGLRHAGDRALGGVGDNIVSTIVLNGEAAKFQEVMGSILVPCEEELGSECEPIWNGWDIE